MGRGLAPFVAFCVLWAQISLASHHYDNAAAAVHQKFAAVNIDHPPQAHVEDLDSCCAPECGKKWSQSYTCVCCPHSHPAHARDGGEAHVQDQETTHSTAHSHSNAHEENTHNTAENSIHAVNVAADSEEKDKAHSCCAPSCEGVWSQAYSCVCCGRGMHIARPGDASTARAGNVMDWDGEKSSSAPHAQQPVEERHVAAGVNAHPATGVERDNESSDAHTETEHSKESSHASGSKKASGSSGSDKASGLEGGNVHSTHAKEEKEEGTSCCSSACEGGKGTTGSYSCSCCKDPIRTTYAKQPHVKHSSAPESGDAAIVHSTRVSEEKREGTSCCSSACEGGKGTTGSYSCSCCKDPIRATSYAKQPHVKHSSAPASLTHHAGADSSGSSGSEQAVVEAHSTEGVNAHASTGVERNTQAASSDRQQGREEHMDDAVDNGLGRVGDVRGAASRDDDVTQNQEKKHSRSEDSAAEERRVNEETQEKVDVYLDKKYEEEMGTNVMVHDFKHDAKYDEQDTHATNSRRDAAFRLRDQYTKGGRRASGEYSSIVPDFAGTNTVFQGTKNEGGVRRGRHPSRQGLLRKGMLADPSATESTPENEQGKPSEADLEDRAPSWNKSWWSEKAWILWTLASPALCLTIVLLTLLSQGWFAALIYCAIFIPLAVLTYYYDAFAYLDGDLFWVEMALALMLNTCLCVCLIPAFAHWRILNGENEHGAYGGYGSFGDSFRPVPKAAFQGAGYTTGYGVKTANTQIV